MPSRIANGRDVTAGKSPEDGVCADFGIDMVFDLGDKVQSSSWIIEAAKKAEEGRFGGVRQVVLRASIHTHVERFHQRKLLSE